MKRAAVVVLIGMLVVTCGCAGSFDAKAVKFVESHPTLFDAAGPEPDGEVGVSPYFGQELAGAESIKAVPAGEVSFVLSDDDLASTYASLPEDARALVKVNVIAANEGEPGGDRLIVVGHVDDRWYQFTGAGEGLYWED